MLIDGQFRVAAPPERVLALLFDARLMAECLPGCETLEALEDDRYRAVVVVGLAGVKARFDLRVEVTARNVDGIAAVTRGEEGGNASTLQATSEVRLAPDAGGTRVDYRSEVAVTGRLGRFALGMMKKKAQSLGDEFAANLQARLADGASAASPATGPEAGAPASVTAAEPVAMNASSVGTVARSTPIDTATALTETEPRRAEAPAEPPVEATVLVSGWQRFVRWLRRALGFEPPTGSAPSEPRPRH